jgi:ABC-type Fe3+ transport system permease subunit
MSTPGQSVSSAWNERMRLIRLRRKKERPRFREELRIIPRWVKIFCVVLYVLAIAIGVTVVNLDPSTRFPEIRDNAAASTLAIIGIVTAMAIPVACFFLMLGYVYRDARRRNMSAPLWTLLVFILAPSSLVIGLIIYLLVREPLPYACPRCNQLVGSRFNFCSNCKCNLHPSCPNCKQEIAETDKFCPYCAQELTKAAEGSALLPPPEQIASPE